MKLLITGASGYVGARLYFDLKDECEVVGTYFTNQLSKSFIPLNVTNKNDVDRVVGDIKPEIIIHIANNPSSEWCAAHPNEAIELNQNSSIHLTNSANKINAKIVYVSTMGAIIPRDLYQKTKANSEEIFKSTKAGYLILRPSVGIGYSPNTMHDNFFNQLVACLNHDKKAIFDTSLKLQPTHLTHISIIIRECFDKKLWNQVIPISVPEMKSRYDIANDILKEFGIEVGQIDQHIPPFNSVEGIDDELREYGLTTMTYEQVINMTIDDIRKLNNFLI